MATNRFHACIFDFDGVIIDSEPLHAQAKQATLDSFQIQYPSTIFTDTKGSTDKIFFEFVAKTLAGENATAEEMDAFKRQFYLKLFETVPLVTGIQEFLPSARRTFKSWEWQPQPRSEIFRLQHRSISFDPGLISSLPVKILRDINLTPNHI